MDKVATGHATLKSLVSALKKAPKKTEAYRKIMADIAFDASAVEPFHHWNPGGYTRNLIARTDHFELLALCWGKGQVSPVHNHAGQDCWMYVVSGTLQETRYTRREQAGGKCKLTEGRKTPLRAGTLAYINDDIALHRISNIDDGRSVSLHLYANPIDQCNLYDEQSGAVRRETLSYYSVAGKKT